VRIKVANHGPGARAFRIALFSGTPGARMIAPENPLRVPAGEERTTSVFVVMPPGEFHDGVRHVSFDVSDGAGFRGEYLWNLLGPGEHERERR